MVGEGFFIGRERFLAVLTNFRRKTASVVRQKSKARAARARTALPWPENVFPGDAFSVKIRLDFPARDGKSPHRANIPAVHHE
jgi:hypothetical protein